MKWRNIRLALDLLTRADRRKYWLILAAQASLSLLDLVAIVLLGLVAVLTAGAAQGAVPAEAELWLSRLGLDGSPVLDVALGLAVLAAGLMLLKSSGSFLITLRVYRFLARRQALISSQLSSTVLARPLLDIQRRTTQDVAYALTLGVNAVTVGILGSFANMVAELALLGLLGTGLVIMDPVVAVFILLFFGAVMVALVRVLSRRAQSYGLRNAENQIASLESIQHLLRSYREVTVAGRRGLYVEQFQDLRWRLAHVQVGYYLLNLAGKYVLEASLVLGAALITVIQLLTRDLVSAIAALAVFLAAVSRILPSLLRLQNSVVAMRGQAGMAEPTLVLAAEFESRTDPGEERALNLQARDRLLRGMANGHQGFVGEIHMRDVCLTYPDAPGPAVDGVSLSIPTRTSLALVGLTGAGKSTLVDLLLGVIDPDEGQVLVSGRPPIEATQQWPGAIAYVPQDTLVASADVRTNVALGLPDDLIEDQCVWEALERAHLAGFVRKFPDGLHSVVGEDGVKLSGGQRQRLGLARALYSKPRLLVLDEATSALDAETEDSVLHTLSDLAENATLIVIAHRLATIRDMDQIAYLDGGRLAALGSFEQVRADVPAFDRQAVLLGL